MISWTITPSATEETSHQSITGSVQVAGTKDFTRLVIASSVATDDCRFTGGDAVCTAYNTGNDQPAMSAVNCAYSCTPAAGSDVTTARTITVTAKDASADVGTGSTPAPVGFTQVGEPADKCVAVGDTLLDGKEVEYPMQVCADGSGKPITVTYKEECSCGDIKFNNTVELFKTGTTTPALATATAPTVTIPKCKDCGGIDVKVDGKGFYDVMYKW
jgi:hypothetical protein